MKKEFLFRSLLLAFLVGFAFWFAMFVRTGLPGHFDSKSLFNGKGPAILPSEKYACIAPGGALKLYVNSCDFPTLIKNRVSYIFPYFLLSFLFDPAFNFWNFIVPFVIAFLSFRWFFSRKGK